MYYTQSIVIFSLLVLMAFVEVIMSQKVQLKRKKECPRKVDAVYYNSYLRMQTILSDNNQMYLVKGKNNIRYGPLIANDYLPRINGSIDSAYSTRMISKEGKDMTVFFTGSNYYLFQHFSYRAGPFSIHEIQESTKYNLPNLRFPKWIQKIDAAFTWPGNGHIYFFSGEYFWKYNVDTDAMDEGYPIHIEMAWLGVPGYLDAAYASEQYGFTYFIKDNKIYKFNERYTRVEQGYPKHISDEWLLCAYYSNNKRGRMRRRFAKKIVA